MKEKRIHRLTLPLWGSLVLAVLLGARRRLDRSGEEGVL